MKGTIMTKIVKLINDNYRTEEIGELININSNTITIKKLDGKKYRSEGRTIPIYFDKNSKKWIEYDYSR